MVRALKYHEEKLLKKVNFVDWKGDRSLRENRILRRYHIQRREDYHAYNKLCGRAKHLAAKLVELAPDDQVRIEVTSQLLEKLYKMGLIPTRKSVALLDKLTASAFCRRRLPVVMVRLRMSETVKRAVQLVEQGHVRVGPETVVDPAYLVTRTMEDFVTWTDSSRIRRHVLRYNEKLDDFDLL